MTLHFLSWAFSAPVETPSQLAVLLVLASVADQDGNLIMQRQDLEKSAKLREGTLDEVIGQLEKLKLIRTFDALDLGEIGIFLRAGK